VIGFLFGGCSRLGPNAGFKIDVGPACAQDFAASRTGQKQEPEDVGRVRIVVLGERGRQPFKLGARKVALALRFGVALDPLARVVRTPVPLHRQAAQL
jgi:hypothetical protein